jgi:hypothetical protein
MLKKIQSSKEAEELKSGDIIYDDFREGVNRDFKIKLIIGRYMLVFLGGDFPSFKIIPKRALISGNWWINS